MRVVDLPKGAAKAFLEKQGTSLAAALSYYTVFSLPALLVLILSLLGLIIDPQAVEQTLQRQVSELVGGGAAEQIRQILRQAEQPELRRPLTAVIGLVALSFGATGAFAQLQAALNRMWDVAPDPQGSGIKTFVWKRLISFGMILVVAFLLLVFIVLSAAVAAFGEILGHFLPSPALGPLLQAGSSIVSLGMITVLFAAIFKILPDARIAWKDVWVGAFVTAALFVLGQVLISLYLGRSDPAGAFGAAGSLVLILLWIYYSAIILIFGAAFTQKWTEWRGRRVTPETGAVRVGGV